MKTVYLASSYSHPDPAVRQARYEEVTRVAADIIVSSNGQTMPFAPITHSHPLFVLRPETGADFSKWQEFDEWMIRNCDELWVLTVDGWRESAGVQAEIRYANGIWKPVKYVVLVNSRWAAVLNEEPFSAE